MGILWLALYFVSSEHVVTWLHWEQSGIFIEKMAPSLTVGFSLQN